MSLGALVLLSSAYAALLSPCLAQQSPFVGKYTVQPSATPSCSRTLCRCCPIGRATISQTSSDVLLTTFDTAANECMGSTTATLEDRPLTSQSISARVLNFTGPQNFKNIIEASLSSDGTRLVARNLLAPDCSNVFLRGGAMRPSISHWKVLGFALPAVMVILTVL